MAHAITLVLAGLSRHMLFAGKGQQCNDYAAPILCTLVVHQAAGTSVTMLMVVHHANTIMVLAWHATAAMLAWQNPLCCPAAHPHAATSLHCQ